MTTDNMVWREIIKGPKIAGFDESLRNLAFKMELKYESDVTKGIWFATTRFTVTGQKDKVTKFRDIIKLAIENYNKD